MKLSWTQKTENWCLTFCSPKRHLLEYQNLHLALIVILYIIDTGWMIKRRKWKDRPDTINYHTLQLHDNDISGNIVWFIYWHILIIDIAES